MKIYIAKEMKQMKKRLFSILLSICMVFTMIPMAGGAVFAATATSVTIGGA